MIDLSNSLYSHTPNVVNMAAYLEPAPTDEPRPSGGGIVARRSQTKPFTAEGRMTLWPPPRFPKRRELGRSSTSRRCTCTVVGLLVLGCCIYCESHVASSCDMRYGHSDVSSILA